MKKILFFSIVIFLHFQSTAQQSPIALVHNGNTTFYHYLDSAIYFAIAGDDIYLPGGAIALSNNSTSLTIDKSINIYGTGYNTDSTTATGNSIFAFQVDITPTASSGKIEGVYASMFTIHDSVSQYTISRCSLQNISLGNSVASAMPPANIFIHESIFDVLYIYSALSPQNVVINKCFIGSVGPYGHSTINAVTGITNLTCSNSILFGNGYSACWGCGAAYFLSLVSYSSFQNCIFYSSATYFDLGGNNNYSNCLFTCDSTAVGGSTASSCIYSQLIDSTFLNNLGNAYNIHGNYHLKPTSPGKFAGIDGTDLGIYGTNQPFREGGIPSNPHIIQKSIQNNTDAAGNLPISIKVEAQNN